MLRCIVAAGRMLPAMTPVIGAAYGLSAALAAVAAVLTWVWLDGVLDRSLATRTLLSSLDAHIFIDLAVHHGAAVRALGVALGVLMGVGLLAQIWANGAFAAAALGTTEGGAPARRAARSLGVLCRLWIIAAAAMAIGVGTILGLSLAAAVWIPELGLAVPPLAIMAGGLGAALPVGLLLVTVHDHARLRCLARAADGAIAAYRWAWGFLWNHGRRVTGLAAALGVLTAAVLGAGAGLHWVVPSDSAGGVTASVVLAQGIAIVRSILRAWWLAAEANLQRRLAGSPG